MSTEQDRITKAEELLVLEKKARQAGDNDECSRLVLEVVELFYKANDYKNLYNYISICANRRGQLKKALTTLVQRGLTYVNEVVDKNVRLELINVLREVTAGKIFLELENARLTKMYSASKEDAGDIKEAAAILHEVQVETYGSMDQKEKADFLLDQMRLALLNNDYVRVQIQAQKVNLKTLSKPDFQDQRIRFYQLKIQYHEHESEYRDVALSLMHIYHTPMIENDPVKSMEVLKSALAYTLLAPYDSDVSDLCARIIAVRQLQDDAQAYNLLKIFMTAELISWYTISTQYASFFKANKPQELIEKHWKDLQARINEHNIRVLAKYYACLSITRIKQLLSLEYIEIEKYITNMVNYSGLFCRIDLPGGTVSFKPKPKPGEVLNSWSSSVDQLLDLIDKTSCDIAKEKMIHALH